MKKLDIYNLAVLICSIVLFIAIPFVMNEAEMGNSWVVGGRIIMSIWIITYIAYIVYPGKKLYACPICSCYFERSELVKKKVAFMATNKLCPFCIKEREVPCVSYRQREE
jgi:accessory gene regulator protein AgrB